MSQILDWLYIGGQKEAESAEWLEFHDIDAVLNVAKCLQAVEYPEGVDSLRIPLRDHPDENITKELEIGYDYLTLMHSQGKKVLVHCVAGISRSATFVIYYLMKSDAMTLSDAFRSVKERRSQVRPNPGFMTTLFRKQLEMENKIIEQCLIRYN